jgi:hypothetical protein
MRFVDCSENLLTIVETVCISKTGDSRGLIATFLAITPYPFVRILEPASCFTEYTAQRPNIDILSDTTSIVSRDFVGSITFGSTCKNIVRFAFSAERLATHHMSEFRAYH